MGTLRFMLRLAVACGLLALLSLPLGEALQSFFMQAFGFCLVGAVLLAVGDWVRWMLRAVAFFAKRPDHPPD